MPLEDLQERIEELERAHERLDTISDRLDALESRASQLRGDFRRIVHELDGVLQELRDIEKERQEGNPWKAQRRYMNKTMSDHQRIAEEIEWAGERVNDFADRTGQLFEDLP